MYVRLRILNDDNSDENNDSLVLYGLLLMVVMCSSIKRCVL